MALSPKTNAGTPRGQPAGVPRGVCAVCVVLRRICSMSSYLQLKYRPSICIQVFCMKTAPCMACMHPFLHGVLAGHAELTWMDLP